MSSRRPASDGIRNIIIAVFAGLVLLFGVFGLDPIGLFSSPESTPTAGQNPPPIGGGSDSGGGSLGPWQVYFSEPVVFNNPDNYLGSIEDRLIQHIQAARQSIHIASFEFNLTPVAHALIAADARGVDVRWITDDEAGIDADEEEGHGQFALLEDAGIPVRDDGRSALMHNKFWIFDRQVVWTGSTNITENGIFRNNNNVVIVRSPTLAAVYEDEFAEMWAGEFGPTSPSKVQEQLVQVDGTIVQVLFGAEDEAMDFIIPLVRSARSDIRFMAFAFTHDGLGSAMLEAAGQGVNLRGIFETRGSETEFSELGRLYCAGQEMRQDGNPGTFHHKVILIDGRIVITGSLNFSDNANDSNDENVLIIENTAIARLFQQEFERRWLEATPPNAVDMDC